LAAASVEGAADCQERNGSGDEDGGLAHVGTNTPRTGIVATQASQRQRLTG
jgi:hypothetical protein